jgi:hypothetical protein
MFVLQSKEFVRLENDFSRRRMGTILGEKIIQTVYLSCCLPPYIGIYMCIYIHIHVYIGMPSGDPSLANIMYIGSYGLGSKRSLDQFIAFTGVDTRSGAFHSDACKQLQWVAYEMDPGRRESLGDHKWIDRCIDR